MPTQNEDAKEADVIGERPDLGRKPDALMDALSGSGGGSDTRAGSLAGGAATGSDMDPDQIAINESLARQGAAASGGSRPPADPQPINNTGADAGTDKGFTGPAGDPAEGKPAAPTGGSGGDDVDAATG